MALRNLWFLRQMSLVFSFAYFKFKGLALGFTHVESGPLARNSYHAEQQRARLFNRCPMSSEGRAADQPRSATILSSRHTRTKNGIAINTKPTKTSTYTFAIK